MAVLVGRMILRILLLVWGDVAGNRNREIEVNAGSGER
jgi:hypothetical protein